MVCGRRVGKTTAMVEMICHGNEQNPGALLKRNGVFWWVGPDYPQMRIAQRMIKRYFGKLAHWSAREFSFKLKHNRAEIVMKSAESMLRGEGLDGLVVDEAAYVPEKAYREDLSPSLKDKRGWLAMGTTPNGFNWLYDLHLTIKSRADWAFFEAPSWANPMLDRDDIEHERELIGSSRWEQEYSGRFVAKAAAIFNAEYFTDIMTPAIPRDGWNGSCISVDLSLGRIRSDWQAVVFLGNYNNQLFADLRMYRMDVDPLCDRIMGMYEEYRPSAIIWEDVGFQQLVLPLWHRKFPDVPIDHQLMTKPSTEGKTARISKLTAPLSQRRLKILDTPMGRAGLSQIRDFPSAQFDDVPDALAQAYVALYGTAA